MSTGSPARPFQPSAAGYILGRPHDIVLYEIVREPLATFLAHTERTYSAPLPKDVIGVRDRGRRSGCAARGI